MGVQAETRDREGGFTLVAVMVALAIIAIMMGVAVQTVTFQMRREKEAELIFRGQQYVEAIRLYRQKYGRYPNSLKEIWVAKPRVIRKKWKDPITDSWYWGLIHPGQGGRRIGGGRGGRGGGFGPTPTPTPSVTPTPFPTPEPGTPPEELPMEIGPIMGVYSRSCDKSIKIYEGHNTYCEWKFILKAQRQPTGGGVRPPGTGGPPGRRPPTGGTPPGGRRPPTGRRPF